MKKFLLFWVFSLPFFTVMQAFAQEIPRREINLEFMVQELFSQQEDSEITYEDLYETLLLYHQNPINLNRTSREELASLFILSEVQITSLFNHINRTGRLLSIYELQAIEGFDMLTINKLLPFVTVPETSLATDNRSLWTRILAEENNYLLLRYERTLQTRTGFTPATLKSNGELTSRYLGSPDKVLIRYRNSHTRDFSLGFTAEKDAGEQFIFDAKTRRYGFDFYSAHFQVYDKGRFKTIALGDYQLQFGQGLVAASGFGVGKGGETINTIRRSNLGIRPYTSVLETNFYRGAAATYKLSNTLDLTGFVSGKRIDISLSLVADSLADLKEQLTLEHIGTSTLQESGFHRTATELARRHNFYEQISGGNLSFNNRNRSFSGGITAMQFHYSAPLLRPSAPYNRFEFKGADNLLLSGYYSYNWRNVNVFGEMARSSSGGLGVVQGLLASLSSRVELALLYRNYARNFHTFYGEGFGENSRPINERGLYSGIKIRPAARWEITAYYDRFRFPWLKYGINAPSGGNEYLVRLLYKPTKTTMFYAQFRTENKEQEERDGPQLIPELEMTTRRNYLLTADYSPVEKLSLRSRVQFSSYQTRSGKTEGFALAQDLSYNFGRFRISTRYAIFDTDDFENRQYMIERDVLYAFSVPMFYGLGTRVYGLLQYRFTRKFEMWLKAGHTHYRYQKSIGSGLEQISGPLRTEVRVQARYRF